MHPRPRLLRLEIGVNLTSCLRTGTRRRPALLSTTPRELKLSVRRLTLLLVPGAWTRAASATPVSSSGAARGTCGGSENEKMRVEIGYRRQRSWGDSGLKSVSAIPWTSSCFPRCFPFPHHVTTDHNCRGPSPAVRGGSLTPTPDARSPQVSSLIPGGTSRHSSRPKIWTYISKIFSL
jgi:hypothetical protein